MVFVADVLAGNQHLCANSLTCINLASRGAFVADQARLPQLDKGDGEEMGGWDYGEGQRLCQRCWHRAEDSGFLGESTLPPRIAPAREPHLWSPWRISGRRGTTLNGRAVQPEPEFELDQPLLGDE